METRKSYDNFIRFLTVVRNENFFYLYTHIYIYVRGLMEGKVFISSSALNLHPVVTYSQQQTPGFAKSLNLWKRFQRNDVSSGLTT